MSNAKKQIIRDEHRRYTSDGHYSVSLQDSEALLPQTLFDIYYGLPPDGDDDNDERFHEVTVILYIPPDSGSGDATLMLQPAPSNKALLS